MTSISIYIIANQSSYHDDKSTLQCFTCVFCLPTDQKCAESSTYWQFFYYRPPGKFRFTHLGEIVKMLCQELDIYIYIYDTLDNRYWFSISVQHGIGCTTFHSFFSWKVWKKNAYWNFQKLAGLWLVGEVDNHVAIYGSKVAEGFSAFQRRSCWWFNLLWCADVLQRMGIFCLRCLSREQCLWPKGVGMVLLMMITHIWQWNYNENTQCVLILEYRISNDKTGF